MKPPRSLINAAVLAVVLGQSVARPEAVSARPPAAALWLDRGSIESLNLLDGPGGKQQRPVGPFTFVKEDSGGASPKFEVVDAQGVHWKVKLGEETKPETAAARLVWATGYFTDVNYYLADLRVEKLPKLARGREFVSAPGIVRSVRMERKMENQRDLGDWKWSRSPFAGTKEFNGLRVMMTLLNNWDLKTANNSITELDGKTRYMVSDLGATFGKTGGVGNRTKSRLADYSASKFIEEAGPELVDFRMKSRPIFLMAIVDFYHYQKLASRAKVGKDIPREHAKWVGQILGRLTPEQIADCFRAGGYSAGEVEGFSKVVQGRIAALRQL